MSSDAAASGSNTGGGGFALTRGPSTKPVFLCDIGLCPPSEPLARPATWAWANNGGCNPEDGVGDDAELLAGGRAAAAMGVTVTNTAPLKTIVCHPLLIRYCIGDLLRLAGLRSSRAGPANGWKPKVRTAGGPRPQPWCSTQMPRTQAVAPVGALSSASPSPLPGMLPDKPTKLVQSGG